MIRRSAGLAATALVLSLVLHFLGIGITFAPPEDAPFGDSDRDTVELGTGFEDLADAELEPVEPEPVEPVEPIEPEEPELEEQEPVEPPEPEEQEPVEPEEAEVPTSEVLVASPNPQDTLSPGSGESPTPPAEVTDPVTQDGGDVQAPNAPEPGGAVQAPVESAGAPPATTIEPEATPQTVETVEPIEAPTETSPTETVTASAPTLDTVESPEVTTTPVAPVLTAPPSPDVIAALPLQTVPPVLEDVVPPVEQEPEETEAEPQDGAVSASRRPRSRPQATPTQQQTSVAGTEGFENLRFPTQTIESPLTSYSRSGVDDFAGRVPNSGSILDQGPGNADTTNYAGQILVHLNSKDPVAVSIEGWARVSFVINPDGSLGAVYVIDGSGSLQVESAAKTQVRRGAPFPRPPGGESRLLTFVYSSN